MSPVDISDERLFEPFVEVGGRGRTTSAPTTVMDGFTTLVNGIAQAVFGSESKIGRGAKLLTGAVLLPICAVGAYFAPLPTLVGMIALTVSGLIAHNLSQRL